MPFDFEKKLSDDLDRLERLLRGQESTIRRAFLDFVSRISSDSVVKRLVDLIQQGQWADATDLIRYEGASLGTAANTVFLGSAEKEASALIGQLARLKIPGVVFNPFESDFANLANQTGLRFMTETTRSQQDAVLSVLSRNIGQDRRATARAIRSSIGLTTRQIDAVANYRSMLEAGSRQALETNLRDRRYDLSVENETLTPDKINRMVEAYRKGMINHRAGVIATTEGGHLFGLAREAGFRQMVRKAGISEDNCTKEWLTRRDNKVRDDHKAMEGTRISLNREFRLPNGETCMRPLDNSLSAKNRCGCRCRSLFRLPRFS